jgi:LruC domain-containing protein
MANGASATLTIVAKVGAGTNGNLTNTATVTSTTADPVLTNNTVTVTSTTSSGPTAVDDIATTTVNTAITIPVLTNDTKGTNDINITTVTLVPGSEPAATIGVFTVDPTTGVVTFTPANGYLGTASIKYTVNDVNGLTSNQATITVTVTPSLINNFPATGYGTLAFEDLWPALGDYDMNDLVLDYKFQITTNANNYVEKVVGTFVIKAFGASLENGFGFQLPGITNASDLTVTGYSLTDGYIHLNDNGTETGQAKPTIIVYDNAFKQMTSPGGIGVNTDPAQPYVTPKTLTITINVKPNTYLYSDLNISNFNPFLIVNKVRGVEVHLPDYAPTSLVNTSLFGTADDKSNPAQNKYYKNVNNLPWAINFYQQFDYPQEKVDIIRVYLHFAEWATSGGTLYPNWYQDLPGYRNASLIYQKP